MCRLGCCYHKSTSSEFCKTDSTGPQREAPAASALYSSLTNTKQGTLFCGKAAENGPSRATAHTASKRTAALNIKAPAHPQKTSIPFGLCRNFITRFVNVNNKKFVQIGFFSQISHMLHSIMLNRKINKTHLTQYKFLLKFRSFSLYCAEKFAALRAHASNQTR